MGEDPRASWDDYPLLLTLHEVAEILRVGYTTVLKMIKDGVLPTVHLPRTKRKYVEKSDLIELIEALKTIQGDDADRDDHEDPVDLGDASGAISSTAPERS